LVIRSEIDEDYHRNTALQMCNQKIFKIVLQKATTFELFLLTQLNYITRT